MATAEEMEWYKAFYVGPDYNLKDSMCVGLFKDLYECQGRAAFPLRDCVLYKEDFLECVLMTKQKLKFQIMQQELAKVDARKALDYATSERPALRFPDQTSKEAVSLEEQKSS